MLHVAAARGNYTVSSFLLEQKGVNIFVKDHWDRDPLDVAILTGNQRVIDDMFAFRYKLSEKKTTSDPKQEL